MGLLVCASTSAVLSMELRWVRRSYGNRNHGTKNKGKLNELGAGSRLPRSIPIYISTLKKDVDPEELRDMHLHCNYSCNGMPFIKHEDSNIKGKMDMKKLDIAISNSTAVVSVFCKFRDADDMEISCLEDERTRADSVRCSEEEESGSSSWSPSDVRKKDKEGVNILGVGDIFRDVLPVSPSNGRLVGFGRAVSDYALTASIYDVMVIPQLQQMGIGKLIVRKIIRILTSRDIYDISAICSEHERLFFQACGFGDDMMGSTTMMYRKTLYIQPHTDIVESSDAID